MDEIISYKMCAVKVRAMQNCGITLILHPNLCRTALVRNSYFNIELCIYGTACLVMSNCPLNSLSILKTKLQYTSSTKIKRSRYSI
jgi:hypothetical protein